jgi:hypothetical protein
VRGGNGGGRSSRRGGVAIAERDGKVEELGGGGALAVFGVGVACGRDRGWGIGGCVGERRRRGRGRWGRRGCWFDEKWRFGGCGQVVVVAQTCLHLGPGQLHELILADVGGEGWESRGGVFGGELDRVPRLLTVGGQQVVVEGGSARGQGWRRGSVGRGCQW